MKKKKEAAESFYVSVRDTLQLRRDMLETSKAMVKMLQAGETVTPMREQKQEAVETLRELMKDIHAELGRLRTQLPHFNYADLPQKKKAQPVKKVQEMHAQPQEPKRVMLTGSSKLTKELADIEKKLQELQ